MKRTISEDASQVAQDLRRAGRFAAVQQMPNPYAVLGVAIGEQNSGTIRRAFLRAVRSYPPQSHPTEFVCVVEAYEMLRNPARRAALEGGLVEVPVSAGKHRRLGGLTPQSAAAFLRARDGPVCALDQHGLCHPAGAAAWGQAAAADAAAEGSQTVPRTVGAAAAAAGAARAPCIQGTGPQAPKPPPSEVPRPRDAEMQPGEALARSVSVQLGAEALARAASVQLGAEVLACTASQQQDEEALARTESLGSAMHLEPLGRTASASSAMSV
mmetsp:Transcript_57710/g.185458  ORF Transcript_57710/g.185458 Transcript_57710/m.185458 type:complete len:270 (-) Transcript_57710:199-1008(-)